MEIKGLFEMPYFGRSTFWYKNDIKLVELI